MVRPDVKEKHNKAQYENTGAEPLRPFRRLPPSQGGFIPTPHFFDVCQLLAHIANSCFMAVKKLALGFRVLGKSPSD